MSVISDVEEVLVGFRGVSSYFKRALLQEQKSTFSRKGPTVRVGTRLTLTYVIFEFLQISICNAAV